MVVEALSIYGQDVYYLPREIVSQDDILNQTIESKFSSAYLLEMYIENTDGFEGDGDLLGKFGIEIRDQATLILARRTFTRATRGSNLSRPREGDLIYLPLSKSLFELKFVEHEQPFYQLNNLVVYKLSCELFEYENEDIDTGLDLIDDVQKIQETTTSVGISYAAGTTSRFQIGEEVTITFSDSSTGTSEVLGFDEDQNPIILNLGTLTVTDGSVNKISVGNTIVGSLSSASATVSTGEDKTSETYNADAFDDSADFEAINNNYIDFSEFNPFGEPNA
tara:strand:- start:211 stop:1047 length:837 start_codon:yes stop_codon:yes gene_type:complete